MAFNNFPYTDLQDLNIDWLLKAMEEAVNKSDQAAITSAEALATANSAKDVADALTTFVTNYFENLDVQEEINNKIQAMFENGDFDSLINEGVVGATPAAVTAWLDGHITTTTPPVDSSLTISGAAADAKAAGDLIRLNYNLADGYSHSVDKALGDSVTPYLFKKGAYNIPQASHADDTTYNENMSSFVCVEIPVQMGDVIATNAAGADGRYRRWGILDSNHHTIRTSTSNSPADGNIGTEAVVDITDSNAAYIVINNALYRMASGFYAYKGTNITKQITDVKNILSGNTVNMDTISDYGTDGVFTDSFRFTIPFDGDIKNQIFTCHAMYELSGNALPPYIQFIYGSGLSVSTKYEIGGNGFYTLKQWRTVRYPGDVTPMQIAVTIPTGCTLYIKDFRNEYSDTNYRTTGGIRINAHRRFPTTPYDTIHGVIMAARQGSPAMIQIPKRTSDGVWICYHDDSLSYDDTYIRQADGSLLPTTYDGTLWSNISFATANSWDWGISKGELFKGTKPMTLTEFFTACAKTGMKPMLSVHPLPSDSELDEIKELARKAGVLGKLGLKGTASAIPALYRVFGNDVESYVYNVSSGAQSTTAINAAITTMNGLTGCTARRVIELFKSTAYLAYFGSSVYDPFGQILAAGYEAALSQQVYNGNPTGYNDNSTVFYGVDMDWWNREHGVTEFTDEYNSSNGLNW